VLYTISLGYGEGNQPIRNLAPTIPKCIGDWPEWSNPGIAGPLTKKNRKYLASINHSINAFISG